MEIQKDFMTYEGIRYNVVSHRVERTVMGTVWRFIMDDRRTLVLTPFQTPKNTPASPGLVPRCVESVLSNLDGLIFAVLDAYHPQEGTKEYDNHSPGWSDRWDKYAADKFAKKDKAAEKSAFELIQAANSRWRGKRLSVAKLKELRDVLFDFARRNESGPTYGHGTLQYALFMWKEITGQDLTESILLAYDERIPGHVNELAKQTAEVEGMSEAQARQLIIKRVSYVAKLGASPQNGGHHEVLVLLQSATCSIHNKEDEDEFRRVAPKVVPKISPANSMR